MVKAGTVGSRAATIDDFNFILLKDEN